MFSRKRKKIIIIFAISLVLILGGLWLWQNKTKLTEKYQAVPMLTLKTSVPIRTTQGLGPTTAAISPDGKYLLVGTPKGGCTGEPPKGSQSSLTLVSTSDFSVVETVFFDDWLLGFAFAPDSEKVFVANSFSDKVSVYSVPKLEKIAEIPAGPPKSDLTEFACPVIGGRKIDSGYKPAYLAVDPLGKFAFVTNAHDGSVLVIDAETYAVFKKIELPKAVENKSQSIPLGILIDSKGNFLYVSDRLAGKVFVIDPKTYKIVKEIEVGEMPESMVFSPDEKLLYVANSGEKTISVIDTSSLQAVEKVDLLSASFPHWIAIDPTGRFLFVGHNESPFLSVISIKTKKIVKTLGKEIKPWMLSVSPDGKYLFVTDRAGDSILVYRLE